jgi:molecular chaperone DnaK (HSP70)
VDVSVLGGGSVEYALGVDLGTTYTAAAVRVDGRAQIVRLGSRRAEIPSLIFVREDGVVLVGDAAERRGTAQPARLAREFKRRLGDPVPVLVGGAPYSAHALMARLLEHVYQAVVRQQEGPPAVVAVAHPANWGPYKRELMMQAMQMADLPDVQLRPEPEAAAVRYASHERVRPGEIVAVYDLGGGTFDAAVLRKTETGFEVLGEPAGIEQLGGVDFDEAVLAHVMEVLGPRAESIDTDSPAIRESLLQLRRDCVTAKEDLSDDTEVMIPIALPSLHTRVRLNRSEFEAMISPVLAETTQAMHRALRSAGVAPGELRSILLAGGSSRIPLVSELLSVEFERPLVLDGDPAHNVALGAAQAAGVMTVPRRAAARVAVTTPATSGPAHPTATTGAAQKTTETTATAGTAFQVADAEVTATAAAESEAPARPVSGGRPPAEAPARPVSGGGSPGAGPAGPAGPVRTTPANDAAPLPPPPPPPVFTPGRATPDTAPIGPADPGEARPRPAKGRTRGLLAAGAAAVSVILVVGVAWALSRGRDGEQPADTPAAAVWQRLADLPVPVDSAAVAAYKGRIWVAGGLTNNGDTKLTSTYVYDPATDKWADGPKLPRPISHAALVATPWNLYFLAGWIQAGGSKQVLKLSPDERSWVQDVDLPENRVDGAASFDGTGLVYAGGSRPGGAASDAVFSLRDGAWKQIGKLSVPRQKLSATTNNVDTVWFLGGRRIDSDVTYGNVDQVTSSKVVPATAATIDPPTDSAAAVFVDGSGMCLVGGKSPGNVFQSWWCDQPGGAAKLPKLSPPRAGLGAARIGRTVYIVGGYSATVQGTTIVEAYTPPAG